MTDDEEGGKPRPAGTRRGGTLRVEGQGGPFRRVSARPPAPARALAVPRQHGDPTALQTERTGHPRIPPSPCKPPGVPGLPASSQETHSPGRPHPRVPLARTHSTAMRPVAETDPSTHHPLQSTGLGSAETEKQQVSQTGGRSGARVPAAGSNHVLLPLTRNCTGFARVLHPHLLRLVTDASPWKPALGKKNCPWYSGK